MPGRLSPAKRFGRRDWRYRIAPVVGCSACSMGIAGLKPMLARNRSPASTKAASATNAAHRQPAARPLAGQASGDQRQAGAGQRRATAGARSAGRSPPSTRPRPRWGAAARRPCAPAPAPAGRRTPRPPRALRRSGPASSVPAASIQTNGHAEDRHHGAQRQAAGGPVGRARGELSSSSPQPASSASANSTKITMRPLCAVRKPGSAVRIEKSGSTPTTTARQSAPKTAKATRVAVGRRISADRGEHERRRRRRRSRGCSRGRQPARSAWDGPSSRRGTSPPGTWPERARAAARAGARSRRS